MEKKNAGPVKGKEVVTGAGKGTVCVTGGTGYLGSWLVMRLLRQGYSVNATVRSDKERLRIFEADLNQPENFRMPIEGCVGVFLVAHPMNFDKQLTEEVITYLSVNATLHILRICLDSKTVKRVVYTSSASTAMYSRRNSGTVDESTWSDLPMVHEMQPFIASYTSTKALTEIDALNFAAQTGMEFVSILPTWIHGPFINPWCPGSVYVLMSMFFGDQEQYKYLSVADLVHVDDVASAHIFLLECPNARGRYICSAVETSADKLFEFLCSRYDGYQIASPPACLGKEVIGGKSYKISSKKLLKTGFKYKYGLGEMYDDAIESCKRIGLI